MVRRVLVFLSMLGLSIAWCMRPLDPEAWRSFVRDAKTDEELKELYWDDDSRVVMDRWHHYLHALEAGDAEAFEFAKRLCPVVAPAAHPSEEFHGALGSNLERRPADVLALMKRCVPRHPSLPCAFFDEELDSKHVYAAFKRRRAAVSELLDGGLSEIAAACLEEMKQQ